MKNERLTVGTSGVRLDRFLAMRFSGYSRSFCKDLVNTERVTVDGLKRPPDYRLTCGEVVRVRIGLPVWDEPDFDKWVIYEDRDLLALNKPAGILTHPVGETWLNRSDAVLDAPEPTVAGLLWKCRPEIRRSNVERCGIVHRLDRRTSGVILAAKRVPAQKNLLQAFRERRVAKVYRAVVLGHPERIDIDAPIGRAPGRRRVQVSQWGREASTRIKTIAFARGMSVVQAEPRTGRTHQIRAHLAHLGYPVAGDGEWFCAPELKRLAELGHEPPERMLLHSYRVRLWHPVTGERASFTAPIPQDFRDYWEAVVGL
ncbi:MAG: RluA family pseudouridine synthase [Elusimicrobiota bacterium]